MSVPFTRQAFEPEVLARIFSKTRSIPHDLAQLEAVKTIRFNQETLGTHYSVEQILYALPVVLGTSASLAICEKFSESVYQVACYIFHDFLSRRDTGRSPKDLQKTLCVAMIRNVALSYCEPGTTAEITLKEVLKAADFPEDFSKYILTTMTMEKTLLSPFTQIYHYPLPL